MKPTARRSITQAVFETLEGRTFLSASITLESGLLVLKADPNTASIMQVQYAGNHNYVSAFATNMLRIFPRDEVQAIVMVGSNENDSIYVDSQLGLPASIEGGAGNDTIKGGTGYDTIDGGAGNDLIYGHGVISTGAGNDTVWGSNRGDSIIAGSGDDLLIGGSGNDTIQGGSGRDTIIGGAGSNKLSAGTGNNILYGNWGNDTLIGGPGSDTLVGGGGGNQLLSGSPSNVLRPGKHDVIGQAVSDPSTKPGSVSNPPAVSTPTVVSATDGTKAKITQFQTTVLAGEGVDVNGLSSVLGAGNLLNSQFEWNFGDPSGRFNDLTGWNAAHVYDQPGTYKITLTVTDASGQVSTATSRVTVGSDNRPVIYVDTNGSDSDTGASPGQAVQTAARAFQLAGSSTKIEFRRGETFAVNSSLMLNGHDMYVGAYGNGANPVLIRGQGGDGTVFYVSSKASNITIQGITFDSIYPAVNGVAPKIPVCAVWAQGTDLVVRGCTFLNVDDAIMGGTSPSGVFVLDNSAPLETGIRGYLCWVTGNNWTVLGNTVANSTREHVIRGNNGDIDSVEIAYNDFAKRLNPQDPQEYMKCTIDFRGGSHIYIADNTLRYGTLGIGPDGSLPPGQTVSWIRITDNITSGQIDLVPGVQHILIDNNLLDVSGLASIFIKPSDPKFPLRHVADVTIDQNTGLNEATDGQFLELDGTTLPGSITLTRNLYSAPDLVAGDDMAAAVLVNSSDLSGFALIADNVWPAPKSGNSHVPPGVNYVNSAYYVTSAWLSPQQWDSQHVVKDDLFQSTVLPPGVYAITTRFGAAGAAGFTLGRTT